MQNCTAQTPWRCAGGRKTTPHTLEVRGRAQNYTIPSGHPDWSAQDIFFTWLVEKCVVRLRCPDWESLHRFSLIFALLFRYEVLAASLHCTALPCQLVGGSSWVGFFILALFIIFSGYADLPTIAWVWSDHVFCEHILLFSPPFFHFLLASFLLLGIFWLSISKIA